MFLEIFLVVTVVISGLYYRLARAITYEGGVPRSGKPGLLGYIWTAFRWSLDAEALTSESRKQFNNRPFVIPTLWGVLFFLPPKYLERVRAATDNIFDQASALNDELQLKYTLDEYQLSNPYQAKVIHTDATRAIPTFIPEVQEECTMAISETLKPSTGQDSISLPVFNTMTDVIARTSNCVLLGKELGRNKEFIHEVVAFAEAVMIVAIFAHCTPPFLRSFAYAVLSSILGGKKRVLKYVIPHLKKYIKERSDVDQDENPALIMEYLLRAAPADESIDMIAMRILNLNFASIHTTSTFAAHALFEMALLSEQEIESIRAEIVEALESEGGWTRDALDRFYKLDSALREVGRFHGLMQYALPRVAVVGCGLEDGQYVPPGYRIAIDMKAIHFDPEIYPDPYRCDLFRFTKLRGSDPPDSKFAFSTLDENYLAFGAGRHACAGRWFASMQLKLLLAHILLEYDVSYPPGTTARPKHMIFNAAIVPDIRARLVFKRRSKKVD